MSLFLANKPHYEEILYFSKSWMPYWRLVLVTNKAVYVARKPALSLDCSEAMRYEWREIRSVVIRSPLWLVPLGMAGVWIHLPDDSSVFLPVLSVKKWLDMGVQLKLSVTLPKKWLDGPETFRIRQILAGIAFLILALGLHRLFTGAFLWG